MNCHIIQRLNLVFPLLLVFFIGQPQLAKGQTVGPITPSPSSTNFGPWNKASAFNRSFTVLSSITLKSVNVVPINWHAASGCTGGTNSYTIDLYQNGFLINDQTATINCGAVNTFDLNFELQAGNYELRIRNYQDGQLIVSNDFAEKSIPDVIHLHENTVDGVAQNISGAFFDWVVEEKTGPVIPLPDTIRLCSGQTYDLNFGAYNSERWASDEPFTMIDDANIRLEPTQSTVYYLEKPKLIPAGENIVVNGDFESGNTGFTTEYTLNTALSNEGDYMVGSQGSNPIVTSTDYNPGTSSGQMLIAKSTPPGAGAKSAWCQTIEVYPNTTYQADFRMKSGSGTNPPFMIMRLNGDWGPFETAPSWSWAQYSRTWNSGSNTSVEMCIQNHLAESDGNILLLDDIRFISGEPVIAYEPVDSVVVIVEDASTIDLGPDANNCDLATNPVTLDAGAGWDNYTWSNSASSQTISVSAPGTYSVAVSSAGGCSGTGEITFTANNCGCTPPTFSLLTPLSEICEGDSKDFEVELTSGTGPFTIYYSLEGTPQTPLTGLALGTHSISLSAEASLVIDSVTDVSCTNTTAQTSGVTAVNPRPTIDLGTTTTICDDGSTPVTLDAGNTGATYSWTPNGETSQTITANTADSYSVTVTDGNECVQSESITITEINCACTPPTFSLLTPLSEICEGDSKDFEVELTSGTGPFTIYYSLEGVAQTPMNGLALGTHSISLSAEASLVIDSVTDVSCTNTTAQTSGVTAVNPLPTIDLGTTTTICDDSSTPLTLDAENTGATYSWTPNGETSQTITVNTADSYSVTVTDGNECVQSESITITQTTCSPQDTLYVCEGGSVNVIANAIPSATWSGTETFTLVNSTTIEVSPTGPVATYYYGVTGSTSFGSNLIVNGDFEAGNTGFTSDYTHVTWMSSPDEYLVGNTGVNGYADGCIDHTSGAGNIFISDGSTTANTKIWCQNITVEPNKNYQVEMWVANAGNPTSNPSELKVTLNGASPWTSVTVPSTACNWVSLSEEWNSGGNNAVEYCIYNDKLDFNGNNFLLDDISFSEIITTTTQQDTFTVIVNPLPSIDLGTTTTICDDGSTPLTLDAGNTGGTYSWTPNGETSQTITVNTADSYSVTVTDGNGCVQSESITVTTTNCTGCGADNDGDGICDLEDLDDDNDGILDTDECQDAGASWDFETPVVGAGNNNQGTVFQGWTLTGVGWINLINPPYGDPSTTAVPQTAAGGDQYVEVAGNGDFERVYTVTDAGELTVAIDFAAWGNTVENTQLNIFEADGITLVAQSPVITTTPPTDWNNAWNHPATVTAPVTPGDYIIRFSLGNNQAFDNVRLSLLSPGACDVDLDGIPNYLDLDSDGDGCPDALEGDGGFLFSQLEADNSLSGTVDANGVPTLAAGGQADVTSTDAGTLGTECICPVVATTNPALACGTIDITDRSLYIGSSDTLTTTWQYWEDANATITLSDPTAIATFGTYYVTNTNAGCTDTASFVVNISGGDNDGDGVCDLDDLDDDNDGILDVDEMEACGVFGDASFENPTSGPSTGYTYDTFSSDFDASTPWQNSNGTAGYFTTANPPSINANPLAPYNGNGYMGFHSQGGAANEVLINTLNTPLVAGDNYNFSFAAYQMLLNGTMFQNSGTVKLFGIRTGTTPTIDQSSAATIEASPDVDLLTTSELVANTADWEVFNSSFTTSFGYDRVLLVIDGTDSYLGFDDVQFLCSSDSDGDGISNQLDTDSDGDDCPDALEGDGGFLYAQLEADSSLTGTVDANGVPTLAGGGQGDVSSIDAGTLGAECICPMLVANTPAAVCSPNTIDLTNHGALFAGSTDTVATNWRYWTDENATVAITDPTSITASGTYYVTNNYTTCEDTASIEITINPTPNLIITDPTAVCVPLTIDLTAAAVTAGSNLEGGALTYYDNAAATSVYGTPATADSGAYFIVAISGLCSDTAQVNAVVNPTPNLVITDPAAICVPLSIDLTAAAVTAGSNFEGGALTYYDNAATTSAYGTPATADSGAYYIVANTGLCSDTAQVNAVVNPLPTVDVSLPQDVCYNGGTVSIEVQPIGGILSGAGISSGQFDPQDASLVVDQGSFVYYDYTDANNCSNRDSAMVTLRLEPTMTPLFSDTSICSGENVTLSVASDITASFEWSFESNIISNTNSVSVQDDGTYTVIASTNYCSSESQEIAVTVLQPMIELSENSILIEEDQVANAHIVMPNSNYTYEWLNLNTGISYTGTEWSSVLTENTMLSVAAQEKHCSATEELEIKVLPNLAIPSAFTPNGDNSHDLWVIDGLEAYSYISIKVYNRWGNLVYDGFGYDHPWDGTSNGKVLPVATYYYVITINELTEKNYVGHVTIIR